MGGPAGAAIGVGFALVSWARTAGPSGEAASPGSTLRADRALVLLLPLPLVIIFAVAYGISFGLAPRGGLHDGLRYGIYGLGLGLALWIAIAFTRAWPWYLATTAWLAVRGQLPWRLARFLEDAHELRILRQVGAVHQFRHARLLEHLARPPAAAASPAAQVPGRPLRSMRPDSARRQT
jgi:hypothetical protein